MKQSLIAVLHFAMKYDRNEISVQLFETIFTLRIFQIDRSVI